MNKSGIIHLYNYISFEINVYICLYIFWYVIRNIVFLFGLLWFVEILAIVCVKLSCSWSELLCWTEMTANWSESGEKMWKVHMSDLCVSSFSYSTLFYITRALLLVLFFLFCSNTVFSLLYSTLLYQIKVQPINKYFYLFQSKIWKTSSKRICPPLFAVISRECKCRAKFKQILSKYFVLVWEFVNCRIVWLVCHHFTL